MIINRIKFKLIFSCLSVLILFLNGGAYLPPGEDEVVHSVTVSHPGKQGFGTPRHDLIERRDNKGVPYEYYMDVKSVYCHENICKIVPVRIYWDNLGVYNRFELEDYVELEKVEGELFTSDDYNKLHNILSNPNSPFKTVSMDDLLSSNVDDDVDATSSATALVFPKNATVQGASLTCYTLWHWANGDISSVIKDITGDVLSLEKLRNYLQYEDVRYKTFAVKYLSRRGVFDSLTAKLLLNQLINYEGAFFNLGIEYLEQAADHVFYSAMEEIIKVGNEEQRLKSLISLTQAETVPPVEYFERVCKNILSLGSYQEVNQLITLFESKNIVSYVIVNEMLNVLDRNILIGRRVYWFLKDQELTAKQEMKLLDFYNANKDYF